MVKIAKILNENQWKFWQILSETKENAGQDPEVRVREEHPRAQPGPGARTGIWVVVVESGVLKIRENAVQIRQKPEICVLDQVQSDPPSVAILEVNHGRFLTILIFSGPLETNFFTSKTQIRGSRNVTMRGSRNVTVDGGKAIVEEKIVVVPKEILKFHRCKFSVMQRM